MTHGIAPAHRRSAREWAALASLLAGLGVLLGLELRASHRQIEAGERARLEHQAHIVEKMLATRLQATRSALDALREDAPVLLARPEGADRLSERMRVMASSTAGVRTFILVDANGVARASNRPELVGLNFRDSERFRMIGGHADPALLYVSPPFKTPLGNWAVSLGIALLSGSGAFQGYILAIIDPEYFNLLLDSTRYAPDMVASMIHGSGKVIYRVPDPDGAVGMDLRRLQESGFDLHMRSGADTSSWTQILGSTRRESLIVLQTIRPSSSPTEGVFVASFTRDTGAFYGPWRKELRDRIVILAVAALAAGLGLFFHQRRRAALARVEAAQREAGQALQAQLARSQRVESIGRLAGGVAHDFNNILTVILSCAEGLRARFDGQDAPATEDLDEILAAGERARDLTTQLLAFARKQVIAPVALDLNSVVRQSQRMLIRLLGEDIQLNVDLQDGLWAVKADPVQVEQVLFNLAVNARDAMPGGGTLTVSTRNLTVTEAEARRDGGLGQGEWVQIHVRDTGTGMPPEVQSHVFEPFFTTKEQGKGTGLGLATVYGIVIQAGGNIHLASQPGQGTTFQISLPPTQEVPIQRGPAMSPATTRGSETILVVEDDPMVEAVIVRVLRSEGYRVSAAPGPLEALAIPDEQLRDIRLMLTDVVMPGLDGRALAAQLCARAPALKVVYLSGYTQDALSARGVLDRGIELLAKPVSRAALLSKLRAVLDHP